MTVWQASVDASWWGTAWVADMGPYSGGDALRVPALPADADRLQYWVATFSGSLTTTVSFADPSAFAGRRRLGDGSIEVTDGTISGTGVDTSTAHLFVVWYDPDYPTDPADLTPPSLTPDETVALAPTPDPPPPIPAAEPLPAVSLYDTDGTFLADLPLAAGRQYQEELSAAGAISFRLPLDDSATALVTDDRIVKVFWRGGFRQAARISGSSTNVAADGRIWREWSNLPGIMSILGGVTVYPEYGLNRASNTSRTFGYMSRTGHGEWLGSGNWTPAVGVSWATMTGDRAGFPTGLDLPNPDWIAKRGPLHDEPPLSYQYFRRRWTTTTGMVVRILATGDNSLDLWLDGEKVIDSAGQGQFTWRDALEVTTRLPAGLHVLAARVRNAKDTTYPVNPTGLLFTMQRMKQNGEPFDEPPLINSDDRWLVSDVTPGFRWAEVAHQMWAEGLVYGYGACDLLPLGFTRTTGSDGVDFDDAPGEHTLDVGSSVLDVLAAATEKDVDVNLDPDTLELRMWNRRGADKSATVHLASWRHGGSLAGHGVEVTGPKYNTLLLQLGDGTWRQRQDAAAVAARGREGGGIAMGSTTSKVTANHTADAQLLEASRKGATFTTDVSTLTGPQAYVDFGLGDTITVPDEDGTGTYAARVMALTVDVPDDGSPVKVTPELMLDHSATPLDASDGGAGTDDPGDLGSSDTSDVSDVGTGGTTSGGDSGGPVSSGGTDVTYDWTANPYGTAYDAAGGTGGYIPDATHSGVPAGTTFTQTVTTSGGYLTINTAARNVGVGTAAASTNLIHLAGHGLPNGHPIYLTGLSTDGAGLTSGLAGWGVVADASADTFQVSRANEDTGVFSTVDVTADYSAVTVMAGLWYDAVDFACHVTVASSASGLILFTRCRHRGPATALSPTGATPAQGLVYNLSNAWVLAADVDLVPDAPVAKLDALYGKNFRTWRRKFRHVIDGLGSHGNNVGYGTYGNDFAWFYPDPEHSDGSHCDGVQVFGGDKHREVGPHIEGLVDASVSSTSSPSAHPIPATTNTDLQVNHASSLAAPTNVLWDKVLLGGGAYMVNVDGKEDRLNLGRINGRFKRNNKYHATSAIAAPSPGAKAGGATIHYDTSGCVYDDDGSTVVPYVAPGTDGAASHLVWP